MNFKHTHTHTHRNLHLGNRLTRDKQKVLKAVRQGKYNILHSKNKDGTYIRLIFRNNASQETVQ